MMNDESSSKLVVRPVCGICHNSQLRSNHGTTERKYYCSGCMSFRLLKLKLKLLAVSWNGQKSGERVDSILDECLDKKAHSTLQNYIASSYPRASIDHKDKEKVIPQTGSIARLANVILKVENLQHEVLIKQLNAKLTTLNTACRDMKVKLHVLQDAISRQKNKIDREKNIIYTKKQTLHKSLRDSSVNSSNGYLAKQEKWVRTAKLNLVYTMFSIWNVKVIKEDLGSSIEILGIPVIPINDIICYSTNIINCTLTNLQRFIVWISEYMAISMPYRVSIVKGMPIISDITPSKDSYVCIRQSSELTNALPRSIVELGPHQLKELCEAIARQIIVLSKILFSICPESLSQFITLSDLLRTDRIVATIVEKISKLAVAQKDTAKNSHQMKYTKKAYFFFWQKQKEKPVQSVQHQSLDDNHINDALSAKNTNKDYEKISSEILKAERLDFNDLASLITSTFLDMEGSNSINASCIVFKGSIPCEEVLDDPNLLAGELYAYLCQQIRKFAEIKNASSRSLGTLNSSSTSSAFQQINLPPNSNSIKHSPVLRSRNSLASSRNSVYNTHLVKGKHSSLDKWEVVGRIL